jgi:hypothetical protein
MDTMDVEHRPSKSSNGKYSENVTHFLTGLIPEHIDLSKYKFTPKQEALLNNKNNSESEVYSLAASFLLKSNNKQAAKQLYAKSALLGNADSLFELSKLYADKTKEQLIEEAAGHNCYRAQVYLGKTSEVY